MSAVSVERARERYMNLAMNERLWMNSRLHQRTSGQPSWLCALCHEMSRALDARSLTYDLAVAEQYRAAGAPSNVPSIEGENARARSAYREDSHVFADREHHDVDLARLTPFRTAT